MRARWGDISANFPVDGGCRCGTEDMYVEAVRAMRATWELEGNVSPGPWIIRARLVGACLGRFV